MPRVPTYDNFQAAPNTLPQTQLQGAALAPNPVATPDVAGQQAQQGGQAMQRFGGEIGRIAVDMAQQANQLRFDDAANQGKEAALRLQHDKDTGFTNLKGINALERPDGKPLAEEYGEKLKNELQKISDGLSNDVQRQAFSRFSGGLLTDFKGQAMQHESKEYQTYALSVSSGVQSTAMRDISLNWNNPDAINSAVDRIKAETFRQAQLMGKSAEWQDAKAREVTSTAHKTALLSALEQNDPAYASAYLRKYSGQMNADDILAVRGHITKDMDAHIGMQSASEVVQSFQPRINTSEGDRAFNIAVGTESGNRQFKDYGYGNRADGTPKGRGFLGELKRPDGNVSTEISVGVQINGKETDIPTLVPTLTKDEIQSLLNGDKPSDAIVQKAVDHAKMRISQGKSVFADPEPLTSPKGAIGIAQVMPGTGPEAAKLAGLPWDEDRFRNDADYNKALGKAYFQKQLQDNGGDLAKAYAAYNAGPGALQKAIDQAKAEAAKTADGPVKPWIEFLPAETQNYVAKNLREFAAGQGKPTRPTFAEIDAQLRQRPELAANPTRYKLARDEASRQFEEQTKALAARDDESVATAMRALMENGGSYSALPIGIRAAIPAGKVDDVMTFGQKIAKGDDTTNPAVYQKLSDPAALNKLSDDQFFALRTELSESDWQTFAKQRGADVVGAEKLNTASISRVLNSRLASLGYDTTPKDGSSDAAHLGVLRQFVDRTILQEQKITGKQMTDADIEKHIDRLMATSVEVKGWFNNSQTRLLSTKVGDISSDIKASLKADFKKAGIDSPSDADLWGAYLNLRYQSQRTQQALVQHNAARSQASGQW